MVGISAIGLQILDLNDVVVADGTRIQVKAAGLRSRSARVHVR